jgi:hypothetical protein
MQILRSWRLSDREYVERVRGFYRRRRFLAAIFILVGLVLLATGIYYCHHLYSQVTDINEMSVHKLRQDEGAALEDKTFYVFGFSFGLGMGIMLCCGVGLIWQVLDIYDRKNRLLLEYYDRLAVLEKS